MTTFSRDQQAVLDLLQRRRYGETRKGGCFCLLGAAGTGKSFLIHEIRKQYRTRITALTGIAAQLIGGCTLHKFLRIGISPSAQPDSQAVFSSLGNQEVLVVDEISMLSHTLADKLLLALFNARWHQRGGLTLLVGDFLQLPPVDKQNMIPPLAFEGQFWKPNVIPMCLRTQHRQQAGKFLTALNDMRVGICSDGVREILRERCVETLPKTALQLFPLRKQAQSTNENFLLELAGEERAYNAQITATGMPKDRAFETIEKQGRSPLVLRLKIGARAVILRNDPENQYVNGTCGWITELEPDIISIETDQGDTVYVPRYEEQILDSFERPQIVYEQFPILLGWAMTIHKAQGMTLDCVGIHGEDHFACGQTYVAMSRVRTLEGLFILGLPSSFRTHPGALEYTRYVEAEMLNREQEGIEL